MVKLMGKNSICHQMFSFFNVVHIVGLLVCLLGDELMLTIMLYSRVT